MNKIIWVGIGGFIGAVLRYWVSGYVQDLTHSVAFPHGTLTVNIIGCFLIGAISYLVESQAGIPPEIRLLVLVGFLGSFTTYSTFSAETLNLLLDQRLILALTNIFIHIFLGLLGVVLGRFTMILIWR